MLSSSLSMLFAKEKEIVAVDCDVDAPNLDIWLGEVGKWEKISPVATSFKPVISKEKCNNDCEKCVESCKFDALSVENGKLKLNTFLCEGCGACHVVCPKQVVSMKKIENGEIRKKQTQYGFPLISAQLFPGETGSGKIAAELKKEARESNAELLVIDSSSGTGCPVIASLRGGDFAVLLTEPTPASLSDLRRILELVQHFKIPYGVAINKWDINKELAAEIEKWAEENFLGKISYDKKIFEAVSNLIPILETGLKAAQEIKNIFKRLSYEQFLQ